MKNIRLLRVELHTVPKRELETYEELKWMRIVRRE